MNDLLSRIDPARSLDIDSSSLRAKVDERIGATGRLSPTAPADRRVWRAAVAAFAVVLVVFIPVALLNRTPDGMPVDPGALPAHLPGVVATIGLEGGGGVKTAAVDGTTLWVMNALQRRLDHIDLDSRQVAVSYPIDHYVEGVVVGGGYVWLASYDNGGSLLRLNPSLGRLDVDIPTAGAPTLAWFGESLWLSDEAGDLSMVTSDGEVTPMGRGEIKGEGLGYLWVNDPETGLISSLAADGTRGAIVIPTVSGAETADGWGVREVIESGGRLWLMDGGYPWGTNLSVFDPSAGTLDSFGGLTFGLASMVSFDGSLWVTSGTDHVVFRIDTETERVSRFALPGKPGGLYVAGESLWATLFQPGAVVQLDAETLIEVGPIAADDWNGYPHRLLCVGTRTSPGPTIILEPSDWIEYGSWSIVQARLAGLGYTACANGYVEGDTTPRQRADDLAASLAASGIDGPYVLVAAGDGVHTIRLFASGRADIAGVVLVDPMPIGFQPLYDEVLPGWGHPPWADISQEMSRGLDDFGDLPLVVIGQDPSRTFLNEAFKDGAGEEVAQRLNDAWQAGLDFYANLSPRSERVTADAGFDAIVSERPDLIVDRVLGVLERNTTR